MCILLDLIVIGFTVLGVIFLALLIIIILALRKLGKLLVGLIKKIL